MNTRKGIKSRLADVLANIKKHEDDNNIVPTPQKRKSSASHLNESRNNTSIATPSKTTPTYILKLYDRSIQFSGEESRENLPLYVLLRSWVHGDPPHKKDPKPKPEEPEPAPLPDSVYSLPSAKSNADINKRFNVYPTEENPDLRIPPSVKHFKKPEDIEKTFDDSVNTMNQSECLELNKMRWKKVKDDWRLARRYHEARYEESFKALHDMCSSCEK